MLSFEFFRRFLLSKRAGSLVRSISRISLLGVWLGVTSLIVVVSVMNGFNRSIRSRLLNVEPHLVIDVPNVSQLIELKKHPIYERLQAEDVDLAAPIAYQDVILRTSEGVIQHAVANGVTRERLLHLFEYANDKMGQKDPELAKKIEELKSGEVILGVGLADMTGLFEEDTVVLIPPENLLLPSGEIPLLSQAKVRGFLLTDVERVDRNSFYYLIDRSFPRLQSAASRVLALEVWLKNPRQAQSLKDQLVQDFNVVVETWEERNASLFFALKMEKWVVSLLVGLSTLIAGLSIISVMVLLLTQKRRDIGNLLAMGMSRLETKHTFIRIGLFLSMSGVVLGVLTGVGLSLFVNKYSQDVLPAFYEETNIPAEVQWIQVGSIFVIALLLSYLALTATMKRLSSFHPSEILRH